MNRHGRLVLVVEDDQYLRALMSDALTSTGFSVIEASNGWTALRQAEEHRPDVILLDLILPEMDGSDVIVTLKSRRRTRSVPVIVVTGEPDPMLHAGVEKADGLLRKPFSLEELVNRAERAVEARHSSRTAAPPAREDWGLHDELPMRPAARRTARRLPVPPDHSPARPEQDLNT
jgi:DNA-binding response OmpR family regulator